MNGAPAPGVPISEHCFVVAILSSRRPSVGRGICRDKEGLKADWEAPLSTLVADFAAHCGEKEPYGCIRVRIIAGDPSRKGCASGRQVGEACFRSRRFSSMAITA